jgi:phosphate ABC transporter phosphate-binding protein
LNSGQRILTPNVLHIPETIGSVVPAYNLPGIASGLNLDGPTLANIYLGNILSWNDPAIAAQNPGITLPAQPIKVAHRSDSSGTTFIWTSFLCLDSTTWCTSVGSGTTVVWPVGVGASGNGGVATYVSTTTNALGYVELNYALQNAMTFGAVKNPAATTSLRLCKQLPMQ